MGPVRYPETSVNNYHTTPNGIPEERRCRHHRGASMESSDLSMVIYFSGDKKMHLAYFGRSWPPTNLNLSKLFLKCVPMRCSCSRRRAF
jgi:hypothetical protein